MYLKKPSIFNSSCYKANPTTGMWPSG